LQQPFGVVQVGDDAAGDVVEFVHQHLLRMLPAAAIAWRMAVLSSRPVAQILSNSRRLDFEVVVEIRPGGEDWFIGSITNEKKRDFDLPLNFLANNKTYTAEIHRDADAADWKTNPIAYKMEKRLVTRDSILALHLAPGGGEAIRLKPAMQEEQEILKARG
jgi:hypothetical protein